MKDSQKIGDWLVAQDVITREVLQDALNIQSEQGGKLGEILTHYYDVPILTLYRTLASQRDADFINLLDVSVDSKALCTFPHKDYIKHNFVVYARKGNTLYIAATSYDVTSHYKALKNFEIKLSLTSPLDIFWTVTNNFGVDLTQHAQRALQHTHPHYALSSKHHTFDATSDILFKILYGILLGGFFIAFPRAMLEITLILSCFFFLSCVAFKMVLFGIGCFKGADVFAAPKAAPIADVDLPIYTILVPLFNEADSISDIIVSMQRLDYPRSKLDIKLIVEEEDHQTINAIKRHQPPAFFHLIIVPKSLPQTKPKACNYALQFAKGEFVTIYDAEDAPEPQQLRKAHATFVRSDDTLACLQGCLNYYNHNENLLSRLFSIEYAMLFRVLLPALYKCRIPIPLGGTSNHIRKDVLLSLGAWDAYNVTEDADFGVRLACEHYVTKPLDSTTLEEAPLNLSCWVKQRSRWIKGYIQTWYVLSRNGAMLLRHHGVVAYLGIHFFIGASSFAYMLAPLLWCISLLWLCFPDVLSITPWVEFLCMATFAIGIITHHICAYVTVKKLDMDVSPMTLLCFPLYFFLHSVASIKGVWQLITKPFYWEKTTHNKSSVLRTDLT